jgi:hypothetical protein
MVRRGKQRKRRTVSPREWTGSTPASAYLSFFRQKGAESVQYLQQDPPTHRQTQSTRASFTGELKRVKEKQEEYRYNVQQRTDTRRDSALGLSI